MILREYSYEDIKDTHQPTETISLKNLPIYLKPDCWKQITVFRKEVRRADGGKGAKKKNTKVRKKKCKVQVHFKKCVKL